MTKAKMDWRRMELTLEGHAGSDVPGKDLVCCAESILTQALVNALADLQMKTGCTRAEWSGHKDDGTLRIRATVNWSNLSLVRGYFEVTVTGLRMLADRYPEYIELREEN